jgi:ParB family chromosome partitioning protein
MRSRSPEPRHLFSGGPIRGPVPCAEGSGPQTHRARRWVPVHLSNARIVIQISRNEQGQFIDGRICCENTEFGECSTWNIVRLPPSARFVMRETPQQLVSRMEDGMEAVKPRLGRGLNALLGDLNSANDLARESGPVSKLETAKIQFNPYQPRKRFDEDDLKALTESVRVHGILQPLVVRQVGNGFQLIAGERRLRAAQESGLTEVPVHVVNFNDQQVFEAALVENIQRADLNPIEKAQGFKEYLDKFGLTQDQFAARLGLDRSSISNLVGLLNLPVEVQEAVRVGQITLGHAKVLKGVAEPERQIQLTRETILKNYSVHALELLVKQQRIEAANTAANQVAPRKETPEKTAHVKGLEDELRQKLAVKVEIRVKAKDKGQIVIGFESNERVLEALKK